MGNDSLFSSLVNEYDQKKEIYLKIRVIPNSNRTGIIEILDDKTLKIKLNAVPEKGRANKELVKYLSNIFSCPKSHIIITAGLTNRIKIIRIFK